MTAVIAKCVLILINSIFLTVGIILAIVGVILAYFPGKVLADAYDSVKDSVSNPVYQLPDSADDIANVPFVNTVGMGLMLFGLFLIAIAFLAYAGACCPCCCRCLLILYAIIVIALVIVQLVVGIMFFVSDSPFHEKAKDELKDLIKSDYNDTSTNAFSMSMNLLHQYYDCCGIDNILDFEGKPARSCEDAYNMTGCYSKLQDEVDDNIVWCSIGLAILCALQIIQVYFAIAVYKDNKIGPI